MIALLLLMAALGFALGFLWGRYSEWSRVLRYIHGHEDDRAPWWIAAGIAADCHWRGDCDESLERDSTDAAPAASDSATSQP